MATLADKLGKDALEGISAIVVPEPLLAWSRSLVAKKFDGSANRSRAPGRSKVSADIEELIVRLAREMHPGDGYNLIAGALANVGHHVSNANFYRPPHNVSPR